MCALGIVCGTEENLEMHILESAFLLGKGGRGGGIFLKFWLLFLVLFFCFDLLLLLLLLKSLKVSQRSDFCL